MRKLFSTLTTRGRSSSRPAWPRCCAASSSPNLTCSGSACCSWPCRCFPRSARAGPGTGSPACAASPPARVPAGQSAEITVRLANVSRLRTGLLLAEDTVPYALGSRPRFVLDGIGSGGSRGSTKVRHGTRGKYTVGPLQVRVADNFGLVSIGRSFTSHEHADRHSADHPAVPPARFPATGSATASHGRRNISASGEDDVAPRAYLHRRRPCTGSTGGPPRGTGS